MFSLCFVLPTPVPLNMVSSVLRFVVYPWFASRRFDAKVVVCRLCGGVFLDYEQRYFDCRVAHEFGEAHLRLGGIPRDANATSAAIRALAAGGARSLRVSMWIGAVLLAVDARRHHSRRGVRRVLAACLKDMVRRYSQ